LIEEGMTMKKTTFWLIILILGLALFPACKRHEVTPPEPFAPSSLTTLLRLTASPNAIFASKNSRGMTTITAKLSKYNGEPLSNRVIYFEVVDATGQKANVGFFEGSTAVVAKTTDANGIARVNYYGPLTLEVTENITVMIKGTVAWEGPESISEVAPVQIIAEPSDLTFLVEAEPDVLLATNEKPQANLTAVVKVGGKPVVGTRVYFLVQSGSPGTFDDGYKATYRDTDETGTARITYIGPNRDEIAGDTSVKLRAQLTESIYIEVDIRVIRQR